LALEGYAHFTSPIRRYPDLIVHRAIKAIVKKKGQSTSGHYAYTEDELEQLGEQCSMTERRADDATRDVESWLKCEFMEDHIDREYEVVIASVTCFGLFVRLVDLHIEGLVHITALVKDYFNFSPERNALIGENSRQVYRLGSGIEVKVVSVNLEDKQIDFELVGVSGGKRRSTNTGSSRSKKPSVREQLKSGKLTSKSKSEKEGSDSKGKRKEKSKPSAKRKPKKDETAAKGKRKPKKKPKSRAAKRIAKKKSD